MAKEKLLVIFDEKNKLRYLDEASKKYNVKVCAPDEETILGLMHIFQPKAYVVCMSGDSKKDSSLLDFLHHNFGDMRGLAILKAGYWDYIDMDCYGEQLMRLEMPFSPSKLIDTCNKLLEIDDEFKRLTAGSKKTVMVIDDVAVMLRMVKAILEPTYEVKIYTSAVDALRMMKLVPPDVVITDYMMPDLDGGTLFQVMMENERLEDIPVIFLTGVDDKEKIVEILKNKPYSYLLKPPVPEILLERVEDALR